MKVSICGWLKQKAVNNGITPAVLVCSFLMCLVGLILIVFNLDGNNETVNRFGIGVFVGGVTYAASKVDKIPKNPKSISGILLVIGAVLILVATLDSHKFYKILNGIGIGLCVGSITYYANIREAIKK